MKLIIEIKKNNALTKSIHKIRYSLFVFEGIKII